jgi:cellulose synthase/poly-beta-1,6-N-acetylglucosamine synthase-like glycosyltransferase
MLSVFIFLATLLYAVGVLMLGIGWYKTPTFSPKQSKIERLNDCNAFISVIVPVRNEETNILNLLHDLLKQDLYFHFFEVIVIDDYSDDSTFEIVNHFKREYPDFPLSVSKVVGNQLISNKKVAITQAIHSAKGELMVCTDGDCRVGTHWLSTIWGFYRRFEPEFITAPVALDFAKSSFAKMQMVEFASLVGSGAATLFWGAPTMCNGANIAYTKKIFIEVGGFEGNMEILTGDDEFLMQKVYQKTPQKVLFLKSDAAIVRTAALPSLYHFYQQRKRWASKWKLHKSVAVKLIAFTVFCYHLLNLIAFYLLFWANTHQTIILLHFLLKLCVEFVFLIRIHNFLNRGKYWFYILPLQLLYSPYAVVMGLVANIGAYQWKGRVSSK